eukprot:TRINITY_DN13995_c0_g1_i1.p1 TRINITY_DN13995_c0_g1~~TRINITY_DN13995_c0_g1_i1.p1  ORF type:complete len:100 (-),score=23.19 TRINITY_DN13995_c0_g1_i1:63-362(-)
MLSTNGKYTYTGELVEDPISTRSVSYTNRSASGKWSLVLENQTAMLKLEGRGTVESGICGEDEETEKWKQHEKIALKDLFHKWFPSELPNEENKLKICF